jgi:FkbM family methyltransferase
LSNPKVSICIPSYNQPELLRKTLDSVIKQSFNDYEIIITDDSKGNCIEKLIPQFSCSKEIRYYKNQEPKGSPENWNYAISLAKGEYIKIMHHDDWFAHEDSLQKFVELLDSNPHSDFAFSACLAKDLDNSLKFVHKPNLEQIKNLKSNPEILYLGNFIGSPSTTIFRKKIDLWFDSKLKWIVDTDFYIRVLCRHTFVYSPNTLVCITTETDRQVTKECCNNKQVELFEYIYLSGRLSRFLPNFRRTRLLMHLLKKYQISKLKDIYEINDFCNINLKEIKFAVLLKKIHTFSEILLKFMKKLIQISNIKKVLSKLNLLVFPNSSKDINAHKSYSQCGEDLIVNYILKNYLKIGAPSYLDIGANDPEYFNNTYYFYLEGSKGVCIEPNPELFEKIKRKRPRDICLNVGIGSLNIQEADFYVMTSNTLSSFSKNEAERLSALHTQKSEKTIKIPLVNINEIITKYFAKTPNFISIDTEGMDWEILNAIDFTRFKPEVFCIETLTYVEDKSERKITEISRFMEGKGYISYADTYINTIYVDKYVWNKR